MPRRPLGRTGLEVTPIGLGGGYLGWTPEGFDDGLAVETVLRALEHGINLIDTSPGYGESERRIGLALEAYQRRGGRRENFILATKTGSRVQPHDYSGEHTRHSVQQSMRLLKTDRLDIVHVHDPGDLTPALAPGGALDVLERFKSEGVIGAIGLGVREHSLLRQFIDTGRADVVLTFGDYNLIDRSAGPGVLDPAAARGVGVINAMALLAGVLVRESPRALNEVYGIPGKPQQQAAARQLAAWADERGIPMLDLALQFCVREPRIATTLVGAAVASQIDADVAALGQPISESVWREFQERPC